MLVIYLGSNYVIRSICLSLHNHSLFTSAAKITTSFLFLPDIKQKDGDLNLTLTYICAAGHQTPLKQQARQQLWCECDSQSNSRT